MENTREYSVIVDDSENKHYINRILIATATTGLVRIEWVQARYGQMIPVNWSQVQYLEYVPGYYPLRYLVADAQNLIANVAIEKDFEWLLLWEHDNIPTPDALMRLNDYMNSGEYPVISGLYYTRSRPSYPLVFRGRGTGSYTKFKLGDLVWVDGVPTGFLLIHCNLLREMAKDSETYTLKNRQIKRIFETPRIYEKFENGDVNSIEGTSDLYWSTKVITGNYLAKAGWPELSKKKYPFLIDTNIFCKHINPDGEMFP
jgi:hypothetical protein